MNVLKAIKKCLDSSVTWGLGQSGMKVSVKNGNLHLNEAAAKKLVEECSVA